MLPVYKHGDTILVNRLAYLFTTPKINDLVIVRDPRNNREILKRVILLRNNTYVVEGDNKKESTDSRVFGPVRKKAIIGRVINQF